jgi:hypothetical protein
MKKFNMPPTMEGTVRVVSQLISPSDCACCAGKQDARSGAGLFE